ncbi:MAG TPA: hypothetical protein VM261_25310 [Kofleriaceae bacterium]|nr:hypothetical protein [Kofleriaceae bacterium]
MEDAAPDEGPDRWCYDALEARTWRRDSWQLSLLRSLELVWIYFDSNPACFANMVDGEQAIEDFLVGEPAAATPPEILDEVRAYLRGARAPGRSTWLALEVAPGHPPFHGVWWRIDGESPESCGLPGPDYAGVYGGASAMGRRGMRALVRPGTVELQVGISLRGDAATPTAPRLVELTRTIAIAPHVGNRVQITFDPAQLVVTPI